MAAIANVYVTLIKKGIRTIEQVPANIRDEVEKLLQSESENE